MLRSMKSPGRTARFLVAIFATVTGGAACTIVYPSLPAGPSFQVRVEDRGRPVYGLRIKLKGSNFTKSTETGQNGTAHFRNIPPGAYQIGAEFYGGIPDGAIINVTAEGPKNTTIPLAWPSRHPLSVQALKGILRWPTVQPDQQLSKLQVELLDARTGRSQKSTQTTDGGAFNLGTPTPGLYFLRVTPTDLASEGGNRIAGDIPIEVDQHAAQLELELDFGWTSCGVTYIARHTCQQQELNISSLSGQVLDPTGASIPRATVRLFNPDRKIAEQLTSDEEGQFVSTKPLRGDYELVVSATGFTSLQQTVQVTRPKDAARPAKLRIQLGIAGSCTHATIQ